MGKRIRVQRRGRGTPTFRASSHKRVAPARYLPMCKEEKRESSKVKSLGFSMKLGGVHHWLQ